MTKIITGITKLVKHCLPDQLSWTFSGFKTTQQAAAQTLGIEVH